MRKPLALLSLDSALCRHPPLQSFDWATKIRLTIAPENEGEVVLFIGTSQRCCGSFASRSKVFTSTRHRRYLRHSNDHCIVPHSLVLFSVLLQIPGSKVFTDESSDLLGRIF